MCIKRAELHGETLLSVINGYIESHDPLVVSMAIEGLAELCRHEVVSVATVWGVLGERLAKDSRCLCVGVCVHYSNVSRLECVECSQGCL